MGGKNKPSKGAEKRVSVRQRKANKIMESVAQVIAGFQKENADMFEKHASAIMELTDKGNKQVDYVEKELTEISKAFAVVAHDRWRDHIAIAVLAGVLLVGVVLGIIL